MPSALRAFAEGSIFGVCSGSGEPTVVFLHGWGRTHHDLLGVAELPGVEALDALLVDLPGFGSSPPPPLAMAARGYAELLVPVLSELGGPVIVIGHSFGGRVAVELAAAHPELVKGLVLCGVPLLGRGNAGSLPAPLRYRVIRGLAKRGLISERRLEAARQRFGSPDYRAATGVMREVLVKVVSEDYREALLTMQSPLSMVWGEGDRDVPLDIAKQVCEILPSALLDVVVGSGHDVVIEAPERVRQAIDSLLTRIG
ncbi:MAG: alpha/beta hydrolase [Actinomycetes bacterium]